MDFEEKAKHIIWFGEDGCCFPKKYFTKEEAQEMLNYLEQPKARTKCAKDYIEWLKQFSDEEYEKRFHRKKSGNYTITGEGHVRYKFYYEEPDYYGEVWSDEPYIVPYFTDKIGRGAIAVWKSNFDTYGDINAWNIFYDEWYEKHKGEKDE